MTGISLERPIQQYLLSAQNRLTTLSDNPVPDNRTNPIFDVLEGALPRDWAENIFLALSEDIDERPEIQDIDTGNNENTGAFLYQSTQTGHNTATGDGEDSVAVQYSGEGHNNAKTTRMFQFTEKGNNVGEGREITQYSTLGDNRATADMDGGTVFQDTETGSNDATGETLSQYTGKGFNKAVGKDITQYNVEGNNEATGQGKGSIMQGAELGDNVASNANYISQVTLKGTNTATGTDEADTIIQQGGGTAVGGKGNDQFFVRQDEDSESETTTGKHAFSVTGGEGTDTINLYGKKADWTVAEQNGKTVYTNAETGDVVTLEDFNQAEDKIKFGAEPPAPEGQQPSPGTPKDGKYSTFG